MNRRTFSTLLAASAAASAFGEESGTKPFRAQFAPHPNLLPTGPKDYLDQLKFAHDLGFRAWEDNGLGSRPPELQEKIGAFARDHGLTLGVQVICNGNGMPFSRPTDDGLAQIEKDMRAGIEVSRRTGQTWMTMIPGPRLEDVPLQEQIRKSVDVMKRCCDLVEEHGIILVQEPLSHGVKGGPPLLRSFQDGFDLCKLVDRKSCKLLADFYHEGRIGNDLLASARATWSEAAYVQYGDNPGRKEPGTGTLDYVAVTKWLREQDYTGVIGMEHKASGKGEDGLAKLLGAYRRIDA